MEKEGTRQATKSERSEILAVMDRMTVASRGRSPHIDDGLRPPIDFAREPLRT
jgi:hypothetical protein